MWGPGDRGVDELLIQFNASRAAMPVLQDAGGDCIALADLGGSGGTARIVAQYTYDPYGQVVTHEHLVVQHAWLRAGHKGLFVDRLDVGVLNTGGSENPRLTDDAELLVHNRQRILRPPLGRYLQQDPNATGMVLPMSFAFHGGSIAPAMDPFNLRSRFRDGPSLFQYLRSSPLDRSDPLGLFDPEEEDDDEDGDWYLKEFMDLMELLSPLPGPSDIIRESLKAVVEDYAANLEWDMAWALDWSLPDDDHSRIDNTWVGLAFGRGLYNAFEIGLPGTERSFNPLDIVAKRKSSGGSGSGKPRGGHTIYVKRGQDAHRNYRNALGSGYEFEFRIPGGRIDAIDFNNKIIRELKPDTPSGRARGTKQLNRYLKALQNHPDPRIRGNYTGYLDTYRP